MPSLPSSDLTTDSGEAALISHDTRKSSTCNAGMANTATASQWARLSVLIRHQVVDIENP